MLPFAALLREHAVGLRKPESSLELSTKQNKSTTTKNVLFLFSLLSPHPIMGTEPEDPCMLGKPSTTEPDPQPK